MHRSQTGLKRRGRNKKNENNKKDKRLRTSDLKADGKNRRYGKNRIHEVNNQRRGSFAEHSSDGGLDKEDVPEGYLKKRPVKSRNHGKCEDKDSQKQCDAIVINNAMSSTDIQTTTSDVEQPGVSNKHFKQKPKDKIKERRLQATSENSKDDAHLNSKTNKSAKTTIDTQDTVLSEFQEECSSLSKTKKETLDHASIDKEPTGVKSRKRPSAVSKSENNSPLTDPKTESACITKSERTLDSVSKTKTICDDANATKTEKKSSSNIKKCSSNSKITSTSPINVKEDLIVTPTVNLENNGTSKGDRKSNKTNLECSPKSTLVKDAQSSNAIMTEPSNATANQAKSRKLESSENRTEKSQVPKKTKTEILSNRKQKYLSPSKADARTSSSYKAESELPCTTNPNDEIESRTSRDPEVAQDSGKGKKHSSMIKAEKEKAYDVVNAESEPAMKTVDKVPANNKRRDAISKVEKQTKKMNNETSQTDKGVEESPITTEEVNKDLKPTVSTKGGKKVKSTPMKTIQVDLKNENKHSDKEISSSDNSKNAELRSSPRNKESNMSSSARHQHIECSLEKSNKNNSYEMQMTNATQHRGKEKCVTSQRVKPNIAKQDHNLVSGKIASESSSEEGLVRSKAKVLAEVQVHNEDSTSDENDSEEKDDQSSNCSDVSEVTERKSIQSKSGREEQISEGESNESEDSTDTDESKNGDKTDQTENEKESSKEEEDQEEDLKAEIAEGADEESEKEEKDGSESNNDDNTEDDNEESGDEDDDDDDNEDSEDDDDDNDDDKEETGESEAETMKEASDSGSDSSEEPEEVVKERSFPKRKPLPSGVKAKLLHMKLGTSSEDRGNVSKCSRGFVTLLKNSNMDTVESEKPLAVNGQMSVKRKRQRSSSRLNARQEFTPELNKTPNHHFTAQTQIIANLRRRQREAREQLLCRKTGTQHAISTDSQSKEDSIRNEEHSFDDQQSGHSNISSASSNNKVLNKIPVKTRLEDHKGGEKLSILTPKTHQAEMSTQKSEAAGQTIESSPGKTQEARTTCSLSAFRRVTGWLRRVPPKKSSLKERLASVAQAIGITDWLFRTFRKRKKRRHCELKRRTAMRLLSTSRLVNQFTQSPQGKSDNEKTLQESIHEDNSQDTTKTQSHEKKQESSKMKKLCVSTEVEDTGTVDSKCAIVFPRIHHLAKTIKISPAAQRSTGSTGQKLVVSVQPAKITLTETKNNIQNRPENRPRYRPLQLVESRSTAGQELETNEEPQVLLGLLKNKTRNENQEESTSQNQTPPVTETAHNDSVGSSFVDSTQDVDDEVEQRSSYEATTHVHWAQNVPGRGDLNGWLSSETLLPRLTIENLSKWTIYQEIPHTKSAQPIQQPKERWEAEDSTEDMLQMTMKKKQDEGECLEVEELSDLSFLENVCESAVLLCLKKRFHRDAIYTSIGHMLLSLNPFKSLNICSIEMAQIYQDNKTMERPPHVFAVTEEAYALSKISEHAPNILISGHTGSGKTEAVKVIVQYLTTPSMRQGDRPLQIYDLLNVLESFGNAKTVLNTNSTRCGRILQMYFHRGALVGCSVTHYLLEKFRVVFQALGERGFHVFYELLNGLSETEKQRLYLQEPETYYYLNQGRACDLPGKNDKMDFMVLEKCLRGIGLSDIELTSIWAILSAILQLGNICFTSFHSDTFSAAAGFRITEIRIVASLLQISSEGLQKSITQRVTRTSYDRVLSPHSVEASIDVRDAISQTLYALLFDWLLEKGNDWLCARETDSSLGIMDICGFENLGVNSLEQLCRNFANEQIQRHSIESLISQEQAEYAREGLCWVPFSTEGSESCLGLLTDRPHGILQILEEQSKLAQATDHTFLQKCHYHHGDSSCYTKPKLPLPVFTLQHYCGPVTYQVHNFLSKNRDRLPDVAKEVLAQSRLKLLSDIVKRESSVPQPQEGKSPNKCQASTLTGRFQLTLKELTFRLKRSHTLFVRCISPNPKKLPGIFDVEFVSSQLRNSGILEAVQLIKDGYPIRIPLGQFVTRYGILAGRGNTFTEDRKYCVAVLTKIFGDSSALYQIGISKVFLKERSREILQKKWEEIQSLAALTLQKNLRGFLNRKNFQEYRRKITVVQAQVRGRQARQRYRRLKNTRVQFGAVLLISRIPSIHKRICQLKATGEESPPSMDLSALDVPAELAAVLNSAQAKSHAQGTSITEVPPPQVKAQCVLSLPPDINNYPFSIFIRSYFRDPTLPPLGQPLQNPLTRVSQNDNGVALELYKLALRFVGNTTMPTWQQRIIGNYIVERCLRQPSLTDEVLCQAASFTVQNNNEEQSKRVGLLLSSLLSCLIPSPTLEKPLLKYVSDQASEGYKAICQSKLLRAKQNEFNTLRTHALTLLEWTANERKGSMVVDIYTYSEEKYTVEVDSWTTAEQLAGWLLQSRGIGDNPRGWSISILDENQWLDLCGDDLLLDLIAEIEDGAPSQPFSDYPFGDNDRIPEPPPDYAPQLPPGHPSFSALELPPSSAPRLPPAPPLPPVPPPLEGFGDEITIPPAPPMQAPSLPPSRHNSGVDQMYSTNMNGGSQRMENYLDQIFNPVFTSTDLEGSENLSRRMKGGGGIGPTRQNAFGSPAYTGMGSMPTYAMPMMNGMMPAMGNMPMMPNMPAMMPQMMPQTFMPQMMPQAVPMPQPVVPSVDPTQLAAQQQAFIQQQALLLAQQMTLQATMLSQQQQQNLPNTTRARSPPPKLAPKPVPKPEAAPKPSAAPVPPPSPKAVPDPPPAPSSKPAPASSLSPQVPKPEPQKPQTPVEVYWDEEEDSEYTCQRKTFKQRREFFQQKVSEEIRVKSVRPPSKILLPIQTTVPESDSDEEPPEPPEPEPQPEIAVPIAPPVVPPPVQKTTETPEKETKKAGGIMKPAPRPEPSREIREIIKMFQSRAHEEPKPFEPVRRPVQTFIKKKDPKEEALERLRNAGPPPSPDLQNGPAPPPPPPPPSLAPAEKMSDSIREKQKPLMGLFQSGSSPFAPPEKSPKGTGRTLEGDHTAKSSISKHTASVFFSYSDANWRLYVRKEIFYPKEKFTHPYYLNLLCEQDSLRPVKNERSVLIGCYGQLHHSSSTQVLIIRDTYSDTSFKLTREERRKMKDFLNDFQVGSVASSILEDSIKKRIVIAARDNWENYFSRLFPVTLNDDVDQLVIGVSHRGFRLLKEVNTTGIQKRHLKTLCSYSFADILSIEKSDSRSLRFNLRNEDLRVHSDHAQPLKILLDTYLQELMKDSNHVVALRSHITDDKSLLQFKKGDIIKVLPMDGLEPGWQFGSHGGRSGLFPSRFVQPAAVPDYYSVVEKMDNLESRPRPRGLPRTISKESSQVSEETLPTYSPTPPALEAAHYTMVEFALKYFRDAQTMLGWKGMAAEGKKAIELVQHTKVPIQESLIYYTDKELNEMATDNFMTLMRFMRDQQYREPDDVKCIYEILVLCREKPTLRDEIYCQILKQITENPKHESCNRGWTLLSLLTGYFLPTPTLLPCVTKHLQDTSGVYQEVSRSCQEHLRHTLLYHGRKHLPPRQELEALLNGRISRRLVILLPGGIEYTTKTKTFTVAADLVLEICEQLLVTEPREVEEFAVFANKNKGDVVRPMRAGDYIHDFLLQDNSVMLDFRRVTWKATLRGRSELFVQVHYSQVHHDYMHGQTLLLSPPDKLEMYTGKVAAILHRIKGASTPPDKQDLQGYIPSSVQNRLNLQTVQQILLQELRTLQSLNVEQAKLRFLESVSALPLFDYNIYIVKRISEPHILTPCFVAVNHQKLLILQNNSQQPSITVNLQDVHSMRTMRPLDSNTLPGVELHYGTPADPHTLWMELQEAKELYHTMALIIETQETAAP